ncbi:MAG: C40 family peptidase [Microscillaceae bacterium]|nr:C40 family peptidase [Microscillaceae bacterium]
MQNQPQYGICHLSLIPVRSEPSDKSELCTQLLFGDAYTIIKTSENRKWLLIHILEDNYQGWIDHFQFFEISEVYFHKYQKTSKYFNLDILTYLHDLQTRFPITLGSVLPFYQEDTIDLYTRKFVVKTQSNIKQATDYEKLEEIACQYLKAPYLWGGKSPWGIDCSGFTQMTYKMVGMSLPRDAYQQADCGEEIIQLQDTKSGDLAFFEREGRIVHVGIILKSQPDQSWKPKIILNNTERLIIHALDTVRVDRLDSQGIYNLDRQQYTHSLCRIKRILPK